MNLKINKKTKYSRDWILWNHAVDFLFKQSKHEISKNEYRSLNPKSYLPSEKKSGKKVPSFFSEGK